MFGEKSEWRIFSLLISIIAFCSCSNEEVDTEVPFQTLSLSDLPDFESDDLKSGKLVWIENCKTCHLIGKQHAPRIGDFEEWSTRLAKSEETLIKNAIEGYVSPAGYEMPARGGNDELSDTEVQFAVSYMLENSKPSLKE